VTWPNDVVTRNVTGKYVTGAGLAAKGRVTFTPTARVVDIDDNIIIEDTITAVLDSSGEFLLELPTTDNALLSPTGWAYSVGIYIHGVKTQKFYAILPIGDGSDVNINKVLSGSTPIQGITTPLSTRGPAGPRGPGTLVGEGPPTSSIGQDGDIYINSVDGDYYGPKTDGAWSSSPFYQQELVPTRRYVHTQASASATWTITHDLGGQPSVTVVDSAGTVVVGEIRYDSNVVVTVLFTTPFSGYAYLT
jgi:hypothetical protein